MRGDRVRQGLAFAFLGVTLFSASIPMTKWAEQAFSPVFTATARAAAAACIALPLLLVKRVPIPPKRLWRPFVYTTLGAVFGWPVLIALALQRSDSAHVTVIAAFMPLMTALIAVLRTHEQVSSQFWWAAVTGTCALVAFSLSRGGGQGAFDPVADLLVVGAVIASSWCYVEGAGLTQSMPGWQVISWVVVLATPITVPLTIGLEAVSARSTPITSQAWIGLAYISLFSMYFGFWAWYRGLSYAGVARGSTVQQLQAIMTLVWSVLLLGEQVGPTTIGAAVVVVASVLWAQRSRRVPPVPVELD